MKKTFIILTFIVNLNLGFGQTKTQIDSLLNTIAEIENSKEITKTVEAEKIIIFGEKSLPILAEFFTDSTVTKVKSECQERNLTKGELSIIMADRIERMPYATITGIQNCTLTFCKNNPNLIEYYLWAIKRDGIGAFQDKYKDWLVSDDRKDWTSLFDTRTKKGIRKEKRSRK